MPEEQSELDAVPGAVFPGEDGGRSVDGQLGVPRSEPSEDGRGVLRKGPWGRVGCVLGAGVFVCLLAVGGLGAWRHLDAEACRGNLEMIGRACLSYAAENGGSFPADWDGVLSKRRFPEPFVCPSDPRGYGYAVKDNRVVPDRVSYEYVAGLRLDKSRELVVAYDRHGNHRGGRNVLMISGGSVEVVFWPTARNGELETRLAEQRARSSNDRDAPAVPAKSHATGPDVELTNDVGHGKPLSP